MKRFLDFQWNIMVDSLDVKTRNISSKIKTLIVNFQNFIMIMKNLVFVDSLTYHAFTDSHLSHW